MATIVDKKTAADRQWTGSVGSAMLARLAARAAVAAPGESMPWRCRSPASRWAKCRRARRPTWPPPPRRRAEAQPAWAHRPLARTRGAAAALPRPAHRQRPRDPRPHPARDRQGAPPRLRGGRWTSPSRLATTRIAPPSTCGRAVARAPSRCSRERGSCTTRAGVVGIIAPWNYPLTLGIGDAIPALLAGNGVVLKPDAQTPFTALWAAAPAGRGRAARRPAAGGDRPRRRAGHAAHRGRPTTSMFTGSTATGKHVAAQAAAPLNDCSMELGGKNPLLVLPDAPSGRRRAGRRARHLLQRRAAVHQHRAALRAHRRLRRVRASSRRVAARRAGWAPRSTSASTWAR